MLLVSPWLGLGFVIWVSRVNTAGYAQGESQNLTGGSKNSKEEVQKLSFLAIKKIHAHLDDDHDGSVNLNESVGYMVDELHVHDKARHSVFHGNDTQISVEDLWASWQQSDVYNWTTQDVVAWLQDTVGLSQYKENFERLNVTGQSLPRLAVEDVSFFQEIGIANLKHRKKVSLRAADAVLFGPPAKGRYSLLKDLVLFLVILLATVACWYSLVQKKQAQKQLENMVKDIEGLQQAEEDLQDLQEKLALAELGQMESQKVKQEMEKELREEISSAKKEAERLHQERNKHKEEQIKMSLVEQELAEVRRALMKAEAEVESLSLRSPQALQQWLQVTYKKESKHVFMKKQAALRQMEEAKEACDKIRKKRGTILGTFRLVHGQGIDEVDQKILSARNALAEVTAELQERQHRWRQIEILCGFPIATDGLLNLALDNMATRGRRSSVAQALAICANLGSMGSIPNPSVSGSDDDSISLQNQSLSRRKRGGSCEREVGSCNDLPQVLMRNNGKKPFAGDRSCLTRRSGPPADCQTVSDTESINSVPLNNTSFDESAEQLNELPARPASSARVNEQSEKKSKELSMASSEELSDEKKYRRTHTNPSVPPATSMQDLQSDHVSKRPPSLPISRSSPLIVDSSDLQKEVSHLAGRIEKIIDHDSESTDSSSSLGKGRASFHIASASSDDFAVNNKRDSSEERQNKDGSLKRSRRWRSMLKSKKKDEDGDTDSLKRRSLVQRLKGR